MSTAGTLHTAIDWSAVASQLEITNGHAARMRFSRFKQHIEGKVPCQRRRAGSTTGSSRSRKNPVKCEKNGVEKNRASVHKIKSNGSPSPLRTTPVPPHVKTEPYQPMDGVDGPSDLLGSGSDTDGKDKAVWMAEQQTEQGTAPLATPRFAESPDRKDVGPFGDVYPSPGITMPKKEEDQPEEPDCNLAKTEPTDL
ncbi:MAG: hypothetical protein M1837_007152 [Sclerophora amabilis]|nr:MAG: hypothetical protein M1837_007152 [Sclerophora amabilis]